MATETLSLNDLPDEILLKILSHFGPEDLCFIISKVCDRWNTLAKDEIMWKTLSYHCDVSSDIRHIEEVLSVAPALHSLMVRDRTDAAHILECLFHKHGDLRKLILENCWLGEDGTSLVANVVDLYPDLESLSLADCDGLTPDTYNPIPRLKKLSELDLSECLELRGKTVCLIADSCQHLKKLSLYGVRLIDSDIFHVINKLGKQLTTLVFDGEGLTDVAYSYLHNCARLQELEVSHCDKMTDRDLLEGIGSLNELTSLRLNLGCKLTAQTLSTFLHRPSMTSIVSLKLSECYNLDDEGLKGIAERCKHLKHLAVRWCPSVTDAGISMVINHCNQLRLLDLRGLVYITGEGWLVLVPSYLPHLGEFCVVGCDNVRDECLEELVAAVPELEVTNSFGNIVGAMRNQHLEYDL